MVKVYNAETGKTLYLKLIQDGSKASLILVDGDGDKDSAGNVLWIDEEGMHFHNCITRDAPFRLDGNREIYKNE